MVMKEVIVGEILLQITALENTQIDFRMYQLPDASEANPYETLSILD